MSFPHLQVRSGYSFYESTITVEKLVEHAKAQEFKALALTDVGVMHGVIPFYKSCLAAGIKPIIGMIVEIMHDEDVISAILLAENNIGYQHLIKIATAIQMDEQCTFATFNDISEGLICLLPTSNDLLQAVIAGQAIDQFYHIFDIFLETFSHGNVFVGLDSVQEEIRELDLPVMALPDVRYLAAQDYLSFDCLQAMKQGRTWERARVNEELKGKHLASSAELNDLYAAWPELITETKEISDRCNVRLSLGGAHLPAFPVPTRESAHAYLTRICSENMARFYGEKSAAARERLQHELDVIEGLGFSDYFLIVADFVAYAKGKGIIVGPGRGSSASSIVAYLLGITTIDPLQYNLLFERFLNPERVTMPDIDVDFSHGRRDEVIDYIREKYGSHNVAQIITYGTFAARSIIRELMKTMGIDSNDQAYINKNIPKNAEQSLLSSIQASTDFAEYIKQTPKIRTLFSVALKLEGLPRHSSTHPAGVVIGTGDLQEYVPLQKAAGKTNLTQYAMDELEAVGLLKFDILALRNLSFIGEIVQSIKRETGKVIDVDKLPLDDEATFRLLQQGKTNGIFQLESAGMRQVLTQLRPERFEDIVVLNALYRPGPMEFIPDYIARKHGRVTFSYIHDDLENVLQPTYGVLIYQEQIMQIAHQFAGFTFGEADVLRKAVSDKERGLMETMRAKFITGAIDKGYAENIAEEIFSWIVKFADYGFPKSHSVVYSKIGYQLAYLKANYPHEFFTRLFGTIVNVPKKFAAFIREARELGVKLLPPTINQSFGGYSVEGDKIRIGLSSIRGVGIEAVREIIRVRKEAPFKDLFDFCMRTQGINRNTIEVLILAGAFDETYPNRASLLASIHQALERAELFGDMGGQGSLLADSLQMKPVYTEIADFSMMKKLADEMELTGMYLSEHPLSRFRGELAEQGYVTIGQVKGFSDRMNVKTTAIIQEIRTIRTKNFETMAFVAVADEVDVIDVVIFPELYREINLELAEEVVCHLEGKISMYNGKKQIALERLTVLDIARLEAMKNEQQGTIYVRIQDLAASDVLVFLREFSMEFPGSSRVIVHDEVKKETYKLDDTYKIAATDTCILNMMGKFGAKNVVFKK